MAERFQRTRRALEVGRVAQRSGILRVLREVGVVGSRPATREGAREFRSALEELGTTYIKLGQLLSSRPDLLPDVYIEELGHLVDEVPPVPYAEIERVIERELGLETFARIDQEPLATASIAQIHAALLASGREVVVKIRRPGIVDQVELDLAVLRATAGLLEGRSHAAQLLQLRALADELEVHLRAELDLVEEAHNADVIRGLLDGDGRIAVAQVIRPHVTESVLVLERIHGRKVEDVHGLSDERAAELARAFFHTYVEQVTRHGVYHADPHRGNVLLTDDERLVLIDFGLLGRLSEDTRRSLSLLLLALAQNRADDVADLILGLSLTTFETDEPAFRQEIRRKLPRYHWRPLAGIRAGEALADLQRISLDFGVRLPPSFALVGKTLSQADSIARTLDASLDPIELLEGEALGLMAHEAERRLEPNALLASISTQLEGLSRLPRRTAQLVERLEEGTMKVGVVPTDLEGIEHVLRSVGNRVGAALIVAALLLASALMARVSHLIAIVGFSLSFALGLYIVLKIVRTPGEL